MIQQALQGDIRCQMLLGYNYLCPEDDVEPNYEEAIKYFKMATPMVTTGMHVEIIPVPIPLMITVADPVKPASEIFWVGL